jgi:curved DNA-binding protein CbpA
LPPFPPPQEEASHAVLKKAFFRLSKEWHPDKVEAEKKDEATVKFQRINAAYQRLLNDDSDEEEEDVFSEDEEEGGGYVPMDILYEFFRYM